MERKIKAGILIVFFLFFLFFLNLPINARNSVDLEDLLQSIIEEKTVVTDIYAIINLGNFFFSRELYKPAQDEYLKALDIDPFNKIALINLSYTSFRLNDYEDTLRQLAPLAGDEVSYAHYIEGMIYKEKRELKKAIEQYEIVVNLIPNHPQLYSELGQLYLDNQQLVKANESYIEMSHCSYQPPIMEKLLDYQANSYCYLHLGNYYKSIGELKLAREAYHKATQFDDDERLIAMAHFYQGEIDLKENNYDSAIIEIELAQKIYPLGQHQFTFNNFALALIEIGDQYYNNGNLPQALTHYQLAVNLGNDSEILADAHYKKGLTYYS
jgi:tetratricopeptide (TPR) repeat protein